MRYCVVVTTHRQYKKVPIRSVPRRGAGRGLVGIGALALAFGCGGSPDPTRHTAPPKEVPPLVESPLEISEVVSSNHTSFTDEFGESPDWIELHNKGTEALSLRGYGLSNDTSRPRQWIFGDVTLGPDQYLVVAASERDVRALPAATPEEFHGLSSYIWFWADNQNTPAGGSYVAPELFPTKIFGSDGTRTILSAKVYLADNTGSLGWSAAIIHHGWQGWKETDYRDFSSYNRAYLEATLPAGTAYDLALCQAGTSCSNGHIVSLSGTGVPNDHYAIPIVGDVEGLDLAHLNGFELRPVTSGVVSSIQVSDFAFSHGGYFLHTNFALSKNGGSVVLSDDHGRPIDRRIVPALKTDVSYGRSAVDAANWVVFDRPTPGAANAGSEYVGVCPMPTLDHEAGQYDAPITTRASVPTQYAAGKKVTNDCVVHYTVDGTTPTRAATPFDAALTIDATTLVKTIAAGDTWLESEVTATTYFIADRHELPAVSIAVEPSLLFDPVTGIYEMGPGASPELPHKGANFWKDIEVPAQIEFFEPTGQLGFQSGVGISIFGNYSRANPEKSLAVAFRGQYGLSVLEYPLFPEVPKLTWFDDFVLRNSGNDFGKSMFRDALGTSLCDTMGLDYQAYRPAVAYINGQYWGIHNLREKVNADYFASRYGLKEGEFDLLIPGEAAQVGSTAAWKELLQKLETSGADTAEEYAYVASQVDIDNFIDYNCAEIYDGNKDWPGNNVKWWKSHGPEGRWRWVLYDLDLGFNEVQIDILKQTTTINSSWPNPAWSTLLLRKLLDNPDFRAHFIARCAVRLSTNFATPRVVERIDRLAAGIRSEIPRFFTRWKLDPNSWEPQVEKLRNFARQRPDIVRQHFADYFELPGSVTLSIDPGTGTVEIDGVAFTGSVVTLTVLANSPLTLHAVAPAGKTFVGYDDGSTEATRQLTLSANTALSLRFE